MRHYYAAEASYAPLPGEIVRGVDVEQAIGSLVALGHPIDVVVRHVLREGDIALLVVDHEIVDPTPRFRRCSSATARRGGCRSRRWRRWR
jgi:hypothetical protein